MEYSVSKNVMDSKVTGTVSVFLVWYEVFRARLTKACCGSQVRTNYWLHSISVVQ